jgi:hypothetical protein
MDADAVYEPIPETLKELWWPFELTIGKDDR